MQITLLNDVKLSHNSAAENRVSATPDTVKAYIAAGHEVTLVKDAGKAANFSNADYEAQGAKISDSNTASVKNADLVLSITGGDSRIVNAMKKGAVITGLINPKDNPKYIQACVKAGISALALEYIPRISRAQSMDVLSSQSNIAGYRAIIEAGHIYDRAFPMMMTAAGTIAPAKVFIMGVGVAGLQAIATARRLGAVTTATDVRPATKEQVASLGAKFIAVENEEFKAAETSGGYAKAMSAEYQDLQAKLTASHISKQDIVVTTALIPGRQAPILITQPMIETMRPGSVIIDLAAERGGNVDGTQAGKIITTKNGVKVVGYVNWPSRMAADSSNMFARNLKNLLPLLCAEDGTFAPHWDDEIIQGCALTRNGAIIHEQLKEA